MHIQFWGYPDTPGERLGTAYCEDVRLPETIDVVLARDGEPIAGHPTRITGQIPSSLAAAAAKMQFGDLISTGFIRDFGSRCPAGTPGAACHARLLEAIPGSFLMVSGAEHHLAPSEPGEPGGIAAVQLAASLSVIPAQEVRDALTVAFTAMGWTVTGLASEEEAVFRVYGRTGRPS